MLASDIVLAVEDATVGQPEVRLGVFPPVAAVLLPRLIGWQRALDLILSGRGVTAAEALRMGLVSQVFPREEFGARVDAYVDGLADLSGPVLRLSKATVRECLELPARKGLEIAEKRYLQTLMALEDPHEGLAAFVEKRKPVWKGA
jgi:cyclohexa-1,5-dienecarbonyl-CoA hydratase